MRSLAKRSGEVQTYQELKLTTTFGDKYYKIK